MTSNEIYARRLRAKVMRLFMRKLYNLPVKLITKLCHGLPVIFPGKYLKNNT